MTVSERYLAFMSFQSVDRPPLIRPGGVFGATRRRWEREGLPAGADLDDYFGTESMPVASPPVDTMLLPRFEEEILEETDEFVIMIDSHGVRCRNFKTDGPSMSEHLEYPIKGPEDIDWLRERLAPKTPGRIDPDWLAKAEAKREADALVQLNGGMYFAFLNEHMGTETLMMTYYDAPNFIHQVNELLCTLCEQAMQTVLPHFQVDRIGYHEDMAYKNGSMISPAQFREYMQPYYERITAITSQYGIDHHLMDSDGDIRGLIPLWLECGINGFAPLEVAAGMDPVALRAEYGQDIRMEGGFDKRILASDKASIKREFERLAPVIDGGGFLLSCDHTVPPDVPFENFAYLIELMKTHFGMSSR